MEKKSQVHTFIPLVLFLILVVLCYLIVQPFLMEIILAALLAYTLSPLFNKLNKKLSAPNVSAFLVCLLVLILIVLPSTYIAKSLAEESYMIYNAIENNNILNLQDCNLPICENLKHFFESPQVKFQIEKISSSFTTYLVTKTSELVLSIPSLIISLFVFLFTLYYFLRDGKTGIQRLGYYLSVQKKTYRVIINRLKEATQGIIYGYVLVAFIQGALGALGFLILGVQSPFFWGVVMAFLALIPYGGAGIVWFPAAMFLLLGGIRENASAGIVKGIILLVYGFFVISGIDNILRPRIISQKAKIHPGIILVGMLGGIYFMGPFGVIIGPLVLALAWIIIETYMGDKPSKKDIQKIMKDKEEEAVWDVSRLWKRQKEE